MNDKFVNTYRSKIKDASYTHLSKSELKELLNYLWIYKSNKMSAHWQVNEFISEKENWDNFKEIRRMNDHGYEYDIKGIAPKYYAIICRVLNMDKGDGAPLIDSKPY